MGQMDHTGHTQAKLIIKSCYMTDLTAMTYLTIMTHITFM